MTSEQMKTVSYVARVVARNLYKSHPYIPMQDLEQEAWLAILAALGGFDASKGELDGFCYRVATRAGKHLIWRMSVAANVPRSTVTPEKIKRALGAQDSDTVLMGHQAEDAAVDEQIESHEVRLRVAQVLAEAMVQGREGEIMLALLTGEMSNNEAAAELGIKANTLYQRTFALRRKLAADPRLQEVR